ncbi:MAG: uroporphyrinogen decarboxylase family protein [Spirochaetota bacterium]
MTGRERVDAAFAHRESDKVPFDFGGHLISGIHRKAYIRLREALGLPKVDTPVFHRRQQTVLPHVDLLQSLDVDTFSIASSAHRVEFWEDETYESYRDEFGAEWHRRKDGGLYFDLAKSPFAGEGGLEKARTVAPPDWAEPFRTEGLPERAAQAGSACQVLDLPMGLEVQDGCFFIRGYMDFFMDLAADEEGAAYLMDRQLDMQLAWWNAALGRLPEISVIRIGDDLGDQRSTLISPELYRSLVKPRHAKLFAAIKTSFPKVKILLHCDGAIRDLLPDLIEIGIDGLNPVQYTLPGMDAAGLKRDFGRDLTFWGGGLDTQSELPKGSPAAIKDAVKRNIDTLAPGGGFVCCQTHIIQSDVPTENLVAYFEAVSSCR